MKLRAIRATVFFSLVAAACLDPLYEEGAPLDSAWVLCCRGGAVDTCYCDQATSCAPNLFVPCAAGRCATATSFCPGPTGGGTAQDAGVATGGGAGGASGGGAGTGGGAASDAGVFLDAGTQDAGVGGGAGGGSGGGGGGGGGGGSAAYEFCCVDSRVTTCACPFSGCTNAPFTPCPGGSCVAGTTASICPSFLR